VPTYATRITTFFFREGSHDWEEVEQQQQWNRVLLLFLPKAGDTVKGAFLSNRNNGTRKHQLAIFALHTSEEIMNSAPTTLLRYFDKIIFLVSFAKI